MIYGILLLIFMKNTEYNPIKSRCKNTNIIFFGKIILWNWK